MTRFNRESPITPIGDKERTIVTPHLAYSRQKVRFPNGNQGEFTYVDDDYIASSVVPVDKRMGRSGLILVEQYRFPTDSWGWEIPAGRPKTGESSTETVMREFLEEAGYIATLWHQLPTQNTMIGRGNLRVDTHLAAGLEEIGRNPDDDEVIRDVQWFPMETIDEMILNGEINSSHTMGALRQADAFRRVNPDHPISIALG